MADSPFEAVASAVIQVFNAEFAPEGFTMIPDNLHEALGSTRVIAGVAPVEDMVSTRNNIVQETVVEVRFLGLWKQEITPSTQVNPYAVAAYAERFRNALRAAKAMDPGTGQVWYFDVRRTWYPNDPTGNKSRFYMTIRAYGNNAALVETSG